MMNRLSLSQLLAEHCSPRQQGEALSDDQVRDQLQVLPDWSFVNACISRTYRFGNYHETLAFVNAIAALIHHEDHHPDLLVSYNRCEVRFNTHSVNGISLNDFICAAKCDAAFTGSGPT